MCERDRRGLDRAGALAEVDALGAHRDRRRLDQAVQPLAVCLRQRCLLLFRAKRPAGPAGAQEERAGSVGQLHDAALKDRLDGRSQQ